MAGDMWKFRFNQRCEALRGTKDQQAIIDDLRALLRRENVQMQDEDAWLADVAQHVAAGFGYSVN